MSGRDIGAVLDLDDVRLGQISLRVRRATSIGNQGLRPVLEQPQPVAEGPRLLERVVGRSTPSSAAAPRPAGNISHVALTRSLTLSSSHVGFASQNIVRRAPR